MYFYETRSELNPLVTVKVTGGGCEIIISDSFMCWNMLGFNGDSVSEATNQEIMQSVHEWLLNVTTNGCCGQ